jgi:hypothetical protein
MRCAAVIRMLTEGRRDVRYILPALSLIPAEAEESVRVEYAVILAQLAVTAHRFLMRLQSPAAGSAQQVGGAFPPHEFSHNALRVIMVPMDASMSWLGTPWPHGGNHACGVLCAQELAVGPAVVRYEEQMAALRTAFTGVFQDLVVSTRSTPFTRRAILPHLRGLAFLLGRKCAPRSSWPP